ncbi:MAG: hypothetical protein GY851_06125 [bacterium]|nr:hypothetical protein [bacterium]
MVFVKTFKGYEDKTLQLDAAVNAWIMEHEVKVAGIKAVLSHEPGGRANSGDLLYTVVYHADAPVD